MRFSRFLVFATAIAALGSLGGCAVYERPYGPPVVAPVIPVVPIWVGPHGGYGHRHWRRW
ncbi:MAG: hypothetical protein KGM99_14170 [Burkholderiales bacterium]|nr:hypothetical protein [Burkholderiales bacterium]